MCACANVESELSLTSDQWLSRGKCQPICDFQMCGVMSSVYIMNTNAWDFAAKNCDDIYMHSTSVPNGPKFLQGSADAYEVKQCYINGI